MDRCVSASVIGELYLERFEHERINRTSLRRTNFVAMAMIPLSTLLLQLVFNVADANAILLTLSNSN